MVFKARRVRADRQNSIINRGHQVFATIESITQGGGRCAQAHLCSHHWDKPSLHPVAVSSISRIRFIFHNFFSMNLFFIVVSPSIKIWGSSSRSVSSERLRSEPNRIVAGEKWASDFLIHAVHSSEFFWLLWLCLWNAKIEHSHEVRILLLLIIWSGSDSRIYCGSDRFFKAQMVRKWFMYRTHGNTIEIDLTI